MPQMKDKLHAIWFCMEIPTEGGALFEVADQQFLELPLGDVPIIVVFTKYDLLVRKFEREAEIDLDSFDEEEFDARNAAQAEEVFQTTCVGPLTDIRMGSVPYMKVSKHPQYKSSLAQLVELTQENIDKAVWLIWALAQRASADVKIQASIEVGKKKYWRGLASSLFFPGKTLIKCLSAIHRDIVIVWNFNDPNAYLEREKFKAIMSHLVEDLVDLKPKSTNSTQISAGTVASVAVALAGGLPISAPIVIPIGAGLIFAQWVYMVYQETPGVIRGLMGYIVDLTIVMQSLFWLVQASDGVNAVRPKLIKLAVKAYLDSGDRARVHEEIKAFVTSSTAFKIGQKDRVLEKVVQLIHSHRFVPPDDFKDIAQQSVNILDEEEGWA